MKRRTFLLALGGGLAAAWWLKPGDQGYTPLSGIVTIF